jgi:recombination protein RecT
MSSKTMIRRLAKMLPLSIEFANAAALDAMSETGAADLAALASDGFDLSKDEVFEIEHQEGGEGEQPQESQQTRAASQVAPDRVARSTAPAEPQQSGRSRSEPAAPSEGSLEASRSQNHPNPEPAPPASSREANPDPPPSESAPRRGRRLNFES